MKRGWIIFPLLSLIGCVAPRGPLRIDDSDANIKILAMRQAAEQNDRSKIPLLVDQLDNDDAAVRFYAIEALRALAGEDFGYVYYEGSVQRQPAIQRWKESLNTPVTGQASRPKADEPSSMPTRTTSPGI